MFSEGLNKPSIDLVIVVNSTDHFEDCWYPFFKLFEIYWPDCQFPIILNTETKNFLYHKLNLQCSQNNLNSINRKLTWSESLINCLDKIKSKYILYLQEDYFLYDFVDSKMILEFFDIMNSEQYAHIRLMEIDDNKNGPYRPSVNYPLLWEIDQKANYRVGLQAGLWIKEKLKSYLRPNETAWEFERWGTLRSRKTKDRFFCQNLDYFNRQGRLIFPYIPTGIVKGKWFEPAVFEIFEKHSIRIDYSIRGIYRATVWQRLFLKFRSKSRQILMRYLP